MTPRPTTDLSRLAHDCTRGRTVPPPSLVAAIEEERDERLRAVEAERQRRFRWRWAHAAARWALDALARRVCPVAGWLLDPPGLPEEG